MSLFSIRSLLPAAIFAAYMPLIAVAATTQLNFEWWTHAPISEQEAAIRSAIISEQEGRVAGYHEGRQDAEAAIIRVQGVEQATKAVNLAEQMPMPAATNFHKSVETYRRRISAFYQQYPGRRWVPFIEPLIYCLSDKPQMDCSRVGTAPERLYNHPH